MARVTVEDCNAYVANSFELIVLAAYRTRKIAGGSPILVERDNDKNPVVALREIGDGLMDIETMREEVILSHCQFQKAAPQEEELEELLDQELASTHYITEKLFETDDAENVMVISADDHESDTSQEFEDENADNEDTDNDEDDTFDDENSHQES